MIYLDASVLLARIFAEDRYPADDVWEQELTSSRLLQYEIWNRIHARGYTHTHSEDAAIFLGRVDFIDLTPKVLARALEPLPVPLRTLDGLHLATMHFLRSQQQTVELLSYDKQMLAAAKAMGISAYEG